jgi:predicted nucleic acid-binding protein
LIVADSSYLSEGILVDESLLSGQRILAPDLAVYETVSVIWKHQSVLRRIPDGGRYLSVLLGLMKSHALVVVEPDGPLLERTYGLARRHSAQPYDMVFVALAVATGLEFRSFDEEQVAVAKSESRGKRASPS